MAFVGKSSKHNSVWITNEHREIGHVPSRFRPNDLGQATQCCFQGAAAAATATVVEWYRREYVQGREASLIR